jgi:hypothetical protein
MKKLAILLLIACFATTSFADWDYSNKIDAMTSKKEPLAIIQSDESLSLEFLYKGKNFANLAVRVHPKQGTGVVFMVEKGQIICDSYRGCPISIRFDDAPAKQFKGTKSADYSSTIIGIDPADKFISSAKKAKKILVEVVMYKSGAVVTEFTPQKPLEWPIK